MNAPDTALNRVLEPRPAYVAHMLGPNPGLGRHCGRLLPCRADGPHWRGLTAFGDIFQCLAALFACVGLMMNSSLPERRTRLFWLLLALGCATWFVGQSIWTYFEVILRKETPNPFIGDVILFLHPVPMIGALALKPHDRRDDLNVHTGYLDFTLLLVWWVYLYLFVVIPWQYIAPNVQTYGFMYDHLAAAENLLLAVGFAAADRIARRENGAKSMPIFSARRFYTQRALTSRTGRLTGRITTLAASLTCLLLRHSYGSEPQEFCRLQHETAASEAPESKNEQRNWAFLLSRAAVVSIPLMALWSLWYSANPSSVQTFRFGVAQVTLLGGRHANVFSPALGRPRQDAPARSRARIFR